MNTLAEAVIARARARCLMVSTAESCTGGLVAAALTDVPGASAVFGQGLVTYSNEAKTALLGVPERILARHGAVSAETAKAMARGARGSSGADVAVSITGIAGPGGGSEDKPVGLVWFGLATKDTVRAERRVFPAGGRGYVRSRSVDTALRLILSAL